MPTVVAVQPSSLVFVAVVAIWAAWFVPHWIRRREHLSTARSVDRFSEAMRVLDREGAVPLRVRKGMVAVAMEEPGGPDAQRLLDFLGENLFAAAVRTASVSQ